MSIGVGGAEGIGGSGETNSIEDDVRKAYEELAKEEGEESENLETEEDSGNLEDSESLAEDLSDDSGDSYDSKPSRETKEDKRQKGVEEEDILPPTDWNAESKEWFKSQPKELKPALKEIKRISDAFQGYRQKAVQRIRDAEAQIQAKMPRIENALKVVDQWLPRWGARGQTAESALMELCAFNDLIDTNPVAAIQKIARAKNVSVSFGSGSGVQQSQNNYGSNERVDLTQLTNHVTNNVASRFQQQQMQVQATQFAKHIDDTLDGLKNETNGSGKYIYPDFHDESFLMREIEPLAQGIIRANPNLPIKDVLTRAYKAAGGRIIPKTSPTTAKLNGKQTTARRANSSVPSGFSGDIDSDFLDIKPGESVEDTVKRVYSHLSR